MFNGNLKLNHRKLQLKKVYDNLQNMHFPANSKELVEILKEFNLKSIPLLNIDNDIKVSLEDGWLSGFTDAEGCFSLRIFKQRGVDYIKIVFILDQKGSKEILNDISMLFCDRELSRLRKTKNGDMYRIEVSCNDINKSIYKKIINYFDFYKLKTTKMKSYLIWKEVIFITLGNQPLNKNKIEYIRSLRSSINKYIIANNSIGHSKKL